VAEVNIVCPARSLALPDTFIAQAWKRKAREVWSSRSLFTGFSVWPAKKPRARLLSICFAGSSACRSKKQAKTPSSKCWTNTGRRANARLGANRAAVVRSGGILSLKREACGARKKTRFGGISKNRKDQNREKPLHAILLVVGGDKRSTLNAPAGAASCAR
jgi:hypothetical protein